MKLDEIAADLGVSVLRGPLPAGWWGAYDWRTHTITLLPGLGPIQYKHVYAHELGHAFYRHEGSSPRMEWEASVWASRQLIDTPAFLEAAFGADTHIGIAAILEVMPADVETYLGSMDDRIFEQLMEVMSTIKSC
jgi:hypothetical protein